MCADVCVCVRMRVSLYVGRGLRMSRVVNGVPGGICVWG